MNLDRLCFLFILSQLPLLWLPRDWFPLLFLETSGLVLLAIWQKKGLWLLLALLQGGSSAQFFTVAFRAESVRTERVSELIKIVKILKQGEYQTAIGVRENGVRVALNWQTKIPLVLEGQYHAEITLRPISSRLNIGNLDRQKGYFAQRISQIGTVRSAQKLEKTDVGWRTQWIVHIRSQMENLGSQGLLLALGFGERAWIGAKERHIFQRTSTAHLIAISGLHIALAFGFGVWFGKAIQWLGWKIGGWQRVRISVIFTKLLGLGTALGYSYLAGFSTPTIRALVAICLILLCQFLRYHFTPWQFWLRVVALLLVLEPMSLLSESFWLSILAVASLIFWYQFFPLKAFLPENGKKMARSYPLLFGLIHLQVGILLVFLPVQLYFFNGISPFAFVANLLIVPLYSFLLIPLILFSLLTDNVLQTWQLADKLVQGSVSIIEPLAECWIDLSYSQQWHLLCFDILILLGLFCWQRKYPKKRWWICVLPILFDWLWTVGGKLFPQPTAQWLNFDVGQGLSMALIYHEKGQRKAILYDTGASWQGGSMAEMEIIPYLKREGIDLKAIFISHRDNDHSGGLPSLQKAFPQASLMSSQQQWGQACEQGKKWQFGHIQLSAVFPQKTVKSAENAHSCVILAEIAPFRLLFTGDSATGQEQQFAQTVGKIDFLQVPHHGSRTSSSHTLLAHTQPLVAVISTGRWNPWKLPNAQIEQRLAQYQIKTFNTAQVGMVQVDFYPNRYEIQAARNYFSPWYQGYFGQ